MGVRIPDFISEEILISVQLLEFLGPAVLMILDIKYAYFSELLSKNGWSFCSCGLQGQSCKDLQPW